MVPSQRIWRHRKGSPTDTPILPFLSACGVGAPFSQADATVIISSPHCLPAADAPQPCQVPRTSYPWPIRDTLVPQTGQVPRVAGLPFLSVTCAGLRISRLALHFMQYASIDTSGDLVWGQFTTSPGEGTVDSEKEVQQGRAGVSGRDQPGVGKKAATFRKGTFGKRVTNARSSCVLVYFTQPLSSARKCQNVSGVAEWVHLPNVRRRPACLQLAEGTWSERGNHERIHT